MLASLLVCASFAAVAFGQTALMINTPAPDPVECQPTLLTWGGGTPPYSISFVDPDNDQTNLLFLPSTDLTSFNWDTGLPAGQHCILFIVDSTGEQQNSAVFTIQPGSDSCLNSASSPPASSTPASSATETSTTLPLPPSTTPNSPPPSTTPGSPPPSTTPRSPPPVTTLSKTPSTTPSPTSSKSTLLPFPTDSGSGSQSSAPSSSSTGAARATGVPAAAPKHHSNVIAIAGGAAGGTVVILLALLGWWFLCCRRASTAPRHKTPSETKQFSAAPISSTLPGTPAVYNEFRPYADYEAAAFSSTAAPVVSSADKPALGKTATVLKKGVPTHSASGSTTSATDAKQPVIMRWDPPVAAATQRDSDPGPSRQVEELVREVQRLKEHIEVISPPAYSGE